MAVAVVITFVGVLVFLSHALVGVFNRIGIPDVLWLLLIGIAIGPGLHLITPQQFGSVGPVFNTVTLILIIFESSLGLRLRDIKVALPGTASLTISSFIAVTLVVGALGLALHLGLWQAAILGVILGGNSPTVVVPLIKGLPLDSASGNILFLESVIGDVVSIAICLALLQAGLMPHTHASALVGGIAASFAVATVAGGLAGVVWAAVLKRMRRLENALFTTPACVFVVYGASQILGLNGAVATLAFGIVLGNIEGLNAALAKRHISTVTLNEVEKIFFSEVVFLLKTFFFVYIGLNVQLTHWLWVSGGALIALLLLVARVPAVFATVRHSVPARDATYMAMMIPKGLAAAVLAGIVVQQNLPQGVLIENLVYSALFFSIVFTSVLVFIVRRTPIGGALERVFAWGQKPRAVPAATNAA